MRATRRIFDDEVGTARLSPHVLEREHCDYQPGEMVWLCNPAWTGGGVLVEFRAADPPFALVRFRGHLQQVPLAWLQAHANHLA
jgi:hypothetical protein